MTDHRIADAARGPGTLAVAVAVAACLTLAVTDVTVLAAPPALARPGTVHPRRTPAHPGEVDAAARARAEAARGGRGPVGGPQLGGRGIIVNYLAGGGPRLPRVPASAYVVANAGTGQVLAAKDPHGWYRPASTLKVLTAITLMPALIPDATVIASRRAASAEPSKVGLIAGDRYRVSDLFKALLMISANDAAIALVQATGSYARGMAMINAEALRLQALDSVAVTPNGLDARGQHVSAYDEALFARRALAIPAFMRDERLRTFRFALRPHRTRRHRHRMVMLFTQNTMLSTFRGDLGGKIGWTTPAGATFIGWARRGGTTLIVTLLHCKPLYEMTAAARLLNWGFAMDRKARPVGTLVSPRPVAAAARRIPVRHTPMAARPPGQGPPGIPLAASVGALLLGVVTGWLMVFVSRRGRRAGSRSGR